MSTIDFRKVQRELARLIQGQVLDNGDFGYSDTLSIDNNRVRQEPYLVAVPSNTADVAAIVKFCHGEGIKLTTKAGGHSATGYCLNSEGIVMDLVNMNALSSLDEGKGLSVGAGTRWIRAYNFLRDRQSDYTVIGGGCAGVGVAGFVLGGGYSFISRSYGLGSDNVSAMEFVTADGHVISLNGNTTDKDEQALYWALRGGGGGNFGVVTKIDLQLHKTPQPRQMMGQIAFPFYRIDEILEFYNQWVLTLPDEMAVYGMLRRFPDPRRAGVSSLTLRLTTVYNGKLSEGLALLKPLTELIPDSVELYTMSLPEWENFVGNSTQIKGYSAYIRSMVMGPGSLTSEVATICKKYMSRAPSDDSYVVWTHTGGKVRQFGADSAYAHRDAAFTFELKSVWNSGQPLQARPNIEWAVDFFDELSHHAQGSYLNYVDPLLMDWQNKYYRQHYNRLLQVKQHWDPTGYFDFQQGIGSSFSPTRTTPLDLTPLNRTF